MKETKELLLKLQELDDEIDALQADEEAIPDERHQLEEGLQAVEARLEAAKAESLELAKKRKEREIELDQASDQKYKFKSQFLQIKSNRELEALQHEIAALEEKGSYLEDEILEILERSEELAGTISQEEENLKTETERVKQEQARLDGRLLELGDILAVKADQRKRLVMNLDKAVLKRYERIRKSKGGLAVTSVENGACGGCFRRIPPHEMQNLKKDDRIITCEGCGRIIIWRWE
jgi:predicted  nucleic acid-binding Zn-ribbon protein